VKGEINDLANLAFISATANKKILDRSPALYFPELLDGRDELTPHLVPLADDLRRVDRYRDFLVARRRLLAEAMTSPHAPRHAARGALPRAHLEALVARDCTVRDIADEVDRSIGTVRHWLRRYGLETTREARRRKTRGRPLGRTEGECARHGRTAFVVRDGGRAACLRCRSERVVARRRRLKEILVAEAGGTCLICGYERCIGALEFHHLDPAQKRFGLGMCGLTRSLDVLRQEAQKCVLLCSNCHVEVEAGVSTLPVVAAGLPGSRDPG